MNVSQPETTQHDQAQPVLETPSSKASRFLSFSVFALLIFTILAGTGEHVHSQLLNVGSAIWEDYPALRNDPSVPNCDLNMDVDQQLMKLAGNHKNQEDDFGLFNDPFDKISVRKSLENQMASCQLQHQQLHDYQAQITGTLVAFRTIEHAFSSLSLFALQQQRLSLVILLFSSALLACIRSSHISFKPVQTKLDSKASTLAQAVSNACIAFSGISYFLTQNTSGIPLEQPEVVVILILGSAAMSIVSIGQFLTSSTTTGYKGSIGQALLSIPIYSYMSLTAAYHFFISQFHPAGLAILFTQMFELSGLYLQIALYIWVGMLLKQTQLGSRIFNVFKPWKLPPEALAIVAIVLMALPTAYTGASGIIIIAMGAVVYQELRNVGTRRQLALAVTAMTGSSGVVLRPCLLIVGIAMLNKEVVTDELYYWGGQVFALTLFVFACFALITKQKQTTPPENTDQTYSKWLGFQQLFPYVLIIALSLSGYHFLLGAHLDEFSASYLLPVIIIQMILWERSSFEQDLYPNYQSQHDRYSAPTHPIKQSVDESTPHIGALLMVMACSYAVGGTMDISHLENTLTLFSQSQYAMMGFLLICLVIIGMLMDPFGALVLVSISLAPIAYQQGIEPVHFWMICLVAFELGYLSPPVAINHVFTRQVVGEKEIQLAMDEGKNFYYRNERILLPLCVMGTTLVLVAYGPMIFK